MTEEVKVEEIQTEVQSDPVVDEALAQGWVPKEEFQGEAHKWVEAGEFLRRGELFSKIDSQSRELKAVKMALQNLQGHYTKVKETEYNRAVATLKQAAKVANREGDYDRADQLESEIESVEKEADKFKQEIAQVEEVAEAHPEWTAWVQRNSWYTSQSHMRTYAEEVGGALRKQGLLPKEVLKKVEEAVRKEFPQKFTNPNRERPAAVESSTSRSSARSEEYPMTAEQIKIMNSFINQKDRSGKPLITKEAYIADLRRIKGEK